MLRQEVAAGTALGAKAKEYLDRGDLVPDEIMGKIVLARVTGANPRGFVLDAYPRNLAQAEEARKLAQDNSQTQPLAEYFRRRGQLISVDGEQSVEQVTKDIIDQLASASTDSASTDSASTDSASTDSASTATRSPAPGQPPPSAGSR